MLQLKDTSKFLNSDNSIKYEYFLQCFDKIKNAVSIYDKEGVLLFANKAFCRNFAITDINSAIGKKITEIATENGLENTATSSNISKWKMFDVLKNGETIADWEVRLDAQGSSDMPLFISNDMYPIFDDNGQVQGMIEISRYRDQDIKLIKNVAGLDANYSFDDIIGVSPIMKECIKTAKEYALSPYNILITGESGVGKELFSQAIHNYSMRRMRPFVALNCATFPENLIESELFGYVGGAFTGASKNGQIGKLEFANSGTLFLDEIGELPLQFQSKLLRVLETWTITRIGSTKSTPVNVHLIAATNRDLKKMVDEGTFRQDLYYRLQVLNVEIPPLRKRKDDLVALSEHFLRQNAVYGSGERKVLAPDAKYALMQYDWPGNIRELKNVISRIGLLSKNEVISREELEAAIYSYSDKKPASLSSENSLDEIKNNINSFYHLLLEEAIRLSGGNKSKAAKLLNVSRKTFYRMLEKYK